jgi:pilus assembly protein Flp/PilA
MYADLSYLLGMLSFQWWRTKIVAIGRRHNMSRITNLVWKLRIWTEQRGQDLIEYALMAGFVAVAAGAIMPGVATSISAIFSQVGSVLTSAATTS